MTVHPSCPQAALLVMESRGVTPGTRSFQFSDAWSRLYQAGEFVIDLMYQPGEGGGKLYGQVLSSDGNAVRLKGKAQLSTKAGDIDDQGQFDLVVDSDSQHDLKLNLNDKVVEINGLCFLKATLW